MYPIRIKQRKLKHYPCYVYLDRVAIFDYVILVYSDSQILWVSHPVSAASIRGAIFQFNQWVVEKYPLPTPTVTQNGT